MEATELQEEKSSDDSKDAEAGGQTFFPSFSPFGNQPLGHSRPFFFQQEGAYSQRPSAYQQQLSFEVPKFGGFKNEVFKSRAAAPSEKKETHGLLGSGNFGVISGGTFYNDNDKEATSYAGGRDNDDFSSYYSNAHGRPSFYFGGASNPKPQKQEQFANFRDFADINTPASPAFSHFVVVYVNKNGTIVEPPAKQIIKPKNIIESLALLDLEVPTTTTTSEAPPTKKVSKSKRKLALLPPEKKKIKKSEINKEIPAESKHLNEPLLALS